MEKLTNLTGFSSGNKSLNILHAQNELEKRKKTFNSINVAVLPDKGVKLKNQIDELESLLQTLSLEATDDNKVSCKKISSRDEGTSKLNKNSAQRKETVYDKENHNKSPSNASSSDENGTNVNKKSTTQHKEVAPDKEKHNTITSNDLKVSKHYIAQHKEAVYNEKKHHSVSSAVSSSEESSSKMYKTSTIHRKEVVRDESHKNAFDSDDEKYNVVSKSDIKTASSKYFETEPFSKIISDSGSDKYLSFRDLTPKDKEKHVKDNVMSSPAFKSWRQPEGIRKTLLAEAKPLIENPAKKGSLLYPHNLNPVFQPSDECVKKIHDSLATYPDDCKEESDPECLITPLMLHQRRGLAWMLWREQQDPKGGILADDMGLGKTLSVIALILKQNERKDFCSRRNHEFECRCTLIVCSASLIHQWDDEITKHCEIDALKVLLYHGSKREKDIKKVKSYDVVITTYNIVQIEKKKTGKEKIASPLFNLKFERIVLDEAHVIKNHTSQTAQAIFSLRSFRKWAVTGTPIHNVFKDIYALVKFLQFSPFDDLKKFKTLTDDSFDSSEQRRNLLMKNIVLRRTKDQVDQWGKPLIDMKNKSFSLHYIELSDEERRAYDELNDKIKNKFTQYLEKNFKFRSGDSLLTLLLRLQQCCNHLSLLKKEPEMHSDPSDVADALSSLTIDESSSSSTDSGLDLTFTNLYDDKLEDISFKSTKIKELFKELRRVFDSSDKDKSVIVSQWISLLDIVAFHLKQEKIEYHVIAGNTKVEERQKFAEDFNNNENGPKIMLLSLKAGGVGLNLIGANHLFLLDLHWNPALEMQACDRIHRVGQKKDVTIHKFICRNTIEEKINELQDIKRRIASNALKGVKHNTEKLTIEDYKMLFGIRK